MTASYPVPSQSDGNLIDQLIWNALVDCINDLNTRDNLKAPTGRTISAGTGLTGGGDLTADRTLAVSFGTAAGTAAQGNDSRILVTQDGTVGNNALGTRLTTLELVKNTHGRWYWTSGSDAVLIAAGASGQPAVPFNTVDGNAVSGLSLSGGVATVANAGRYDVSGQVLVTTTGSTVSTIWAYLIHTSGANTYVRAAFQYTNAPSNSDMYLAVGTNDVTCAAGDTLQIQVAKAQTAAGLSLISAKNTLRQSNFGIHRVG